MDFAKTLSKEFDIKLEYSNNIISLIGEGNTIPFIARYRKEMHGTMDDQLLREFADRLKYLQGLEIRKQEIEKSITDQGKWTDELKTALEKAQTLTEVEDIYRPYKQKKKTRASVAIEKGLAPLAEIIYGQANTSGTLEDVAMPFVDAEKGIITPLDAINGASDIVAEQISDDANVRKDLRELAYKIATIDTKKYLKEDKTYEMYFEYSERIDKIPSHRILAINRGESEFCLKVGITMEQTSALEKIYNRHIKNTQNIFYQTMLNICADSYSRLILPSIERELRNDLTDKASEQAIKMFEVNLKPLLMQPPLKGKTILAVDPAYRTGCKIAVIDENGNVLDTAVVYPTPPQSKIEESTLILSKLINKHKVDVISIGNGTASKEAEIFVANLIKVCGRQVTYAVVNEAGASVYSASKLGASEFPEFDVSLRSAVSIARRLQDPLAELIKIDVKSIGVGQYQHDMPQTKLTNVLNGVVENCVNSVGVDLNTASPSLLAFVAGLNATAAKNIVDYRKTTKFTSRKQLLEVPKLGAKTFEQCAGFLRIPNADNVLDNTGVHPETYQATLKLLEKFGYTQEDVKNNKLIDLKSKIENTGKEKVAQSLDIGVITLDDIVNELLKPGRDIRMNLPLPLLRSDLLDIKDLKPGMEIDGIVRNVIDFGVFVDIGVHQDGLVHISQISDNYISHPSQVLSVGDKVHVKVLDVDLTKNKISLTMKMNEKQLGEKRQPQVKKVEKKEESLDEMLKKLQNKYNRH